MDNYDQITQTLRAYEADAPGVEKFIRDSILGAVDSYRPELESVRNYEQSQLPAFFNSFSGYGMGTGASDLSPTTRLASAMKDVSRQATMGMTARDVLDARKARVEDLIAQTYGQWQAGYSAQQNAWQRAWQEKQAEEERRRWEAEMALQRQKASGSGGIYGYGGGAGTGAGNELVIDTGGGSEDTGGGSEEPAKTSWTQKVMNTLSKDSPLTGYDYSTTTPTPGNVAASMYLNPLATITKTLGGAVGNLVGNWQNPNMSFIEKLYNIR